MGSNSISFGAFRGGMVGSQERGHVRSNTPQPVFLADNTKTATYRDPMRTQQILNLSKAVPLGQG